MRLKTDINREELSLLLEDESKALEYIAALKWENGYRCRSCDNDNFCQGKSHASRRCTRCKKDESAISHTLFHNCKFPINKALYIAYSLCVAGENYTVKELADQLSINPMTGWRFRKRIEECLLKFEDRGVESLRDVLLSYETA